MKRTTSHVYGVKNTLRPKHTMEMELERLFARKVEIAVQTAAADPILNAISKKVFKTFYEMVRSRVFDTPSFQ